MVIGSNGVRVALSDRGLFLQSQADLYCYTGISCGGLLPRWAVQRVEWHIPLEVAHCCQYICLLHVRPGVPRVSLQSSQAVGQRVHVPAQKQRAHQVSSLLDNSSCFACLPFPVSSSDYLSEKVNPLFNLETQSSSDDRTLITVCKLLKNAVISIWMTFNIKSC